MLFKWNDNFGNVELIDQLTMWYFEIGVKKNKLENTTYRVFPL